MSYQDPNFDKELYRKRRKLGLRGQVPENDKHMRQEMRQLAKTQKVSKKFTVKKKDKK